VTFLILDTTVIRLGTANAIRIAPRVLPGGALFYRRLCTDQGSASGLSQGPRCTTSQLGRNAVGYRRPHGRMAAVCVLDGRGGFHSRSREPDVRPFSGDISPCDRRHTLPCWAAGDRARLPGSFCFLFWSDWPLGRWWWSAAAER
jgi:hypothetical protein